MATAGTGGGREAAARAGTASVKALCLALCCGLVAWAAGCGVQSACPPLVVLAVSPADGEMLAQGLPVSIQFNLPFDEQSLAGGLSVHPPAEIELVSAGAVALVYLKEPVPGQVYTVSVSAGVRGTAGERLDDALMTRFVVVPQGAVPAGEEDEPGPPGDPGTAAGGPAGVRLGLDGRSLFACDLGGSYEVPHFDSVRLYLSRPPRTGEESRLALLEVDLRGQRSLVRAVAVPGERWIDLRLGKVALPGLNYELHWISEGPEGEPSDERLFTFSVRGTPRVYVWSLQPSSGRLAGVGQLDLGFEVQRLVGGAGGPIFALGDPGGVAWEGLVIVQQLDRRLMPVGQPVGAYADTHEPLAHSRGIMVSGPAGGIAPVVGEGDWHGYTPESPAGPESPDEPVLIALTAGGPVAMVRGTDVGAKFISPGSLSPDGRTLAFVTHEFTTSGTLVRLWAMSLPEDWRTSETWEERRFPREIARAMYPGEPGSHFSYGGTALWGADGNRIWWDVLLSGGRVAEIWNVDVTTGRRELFVEGGAMPLESPDGTMLFYRTSSGGVICTVDGNPVRTIRQAFFWACWIPDGTGVLLATGEGILVVPCRGAVRQVVGFPAGPGIFVGPDEFWFVSDRRF